MKNMDLLYKVVSTWLDSRFSDLKVTIVDRESYGYDTFKLYRDNNGLTLFEISYSDKKIWVSEKNVTSVMYGIFSLDYDLIMELIKRWLIVKYDVPRDYNIDDTNFFKKENP